MKILLSIALLGLASAVTVNFENHDDFVDDFLMSDFYSQFVEN